MGFFKKVKEKAKDAELYLERAKFKRRMREDQRMRDRERNQEREIYRLEKQKKLAMNDKKIRRLRRQTQTIQTLPKARGDPHLFTRTPLMTRAMTGKTTTKKKKLVKRVEFYG